MNPSSSHSPLILGKAEWITAIIFIAFGIWAQARVGNAWAAPALPAGASFDLPAELADWQKVTREASIVERPQTEARESLVWQFRRGDLIASVAIDYPFAGYHELTTCYGVSGWTMQQRTSDAGAIEVAMSKPAGLSGWLFFHGIGEDGNIVAPPPPLSGSGVWTNFEIAAQFGLGKPTYQVQTLVQAYTPLNTEELNSVRHLYQAAAASLRSQLLAQLPAQSATTPTAGPR